MTNTRDGKKKGYRFSQKDEQIIAFIEKFGAVDSSHIARIFYAGHSQAETLARVHLNKIAQAPETSIQKSKEKNVFSGRYDYYTKGGQINHKKKVVDFYVALLEGPGEILEFIPEYIVGNVRADAFIAYAVNGVVKLYFLEVQLSNTKPDLEKYERLKLNGDWELEQFPLVVIVSRLNYHLKSDIVDFVQLPIDLTGWEKILL